MVAVCFDIRFGMLLGLARSSDMVSIVFLAWFCTASKILDPILGTRVGSKSLDSSEDAVLALADDDARAVSDGRISVVI